MTPERVVSVPKATPVFEAWTDASLPDDYGGKQLLVVKGKPAFAELAILWTLTEVGWKGVWIDSYRRKYRVDYWDTPPVAALPREPAELLERIYSHAGSRHGAWDVFCWLGSDLLFAEAKRRRKDRIRGSQLQWLAAALDEGLSETNFLVVEWSLRQEHGGSV